jgi:hypothetical protein
MKKFAILAILGFSALSTLSAHADLLGTTVNGTLNFDNSSTNSFLTPTTTVTPGLTPEFVGTYNVTAKVGRKVVQVATDTVSAYFGAFGVIIRDQCSSSILGGCLLSPAFSVSFSDLDISPTDVFLFLAAPNLKSYSVVGDTLNVDFRALGPGDLINDSFSAFAILSPNAPAPTPEPGSIVLLGTGLLGFAGTRWRRT